MLLMMLVFTMPSLYYGTELLAQEFCDALYSLCPHTSWYFPLIARVRKFLCNMVLTAPLVFVNAKHKQFSVVSNFTIHEFTHLGGAVCDKIFRNCFSLGAPL